MSHSVLSLAKRNDIISSALSLWPIQSVQYIMVSVFLVQFLWKLFSNNNDKKNDNK